MDGWSFYILLVRIPTQKYFAFITGNSEISEYNKSLMFDQIRSRAVTNRVLSPKRSILLHAWATCSELPSILSTILKSNFYDIDLREENFLRACVKHIVSYHFMHHAREAFMSESPAPGRGTARAPCGDSIASRTDVLAFIRAACLIWRKEH